MKNRDGGDYEGKKWDVYVYGDVNIDLVVPGVSSLPKPGQEDEVPVMDTYVGGGAALFAADRILKYLSRTGKLKWERRYVRLTHLENRGFFLGLGQKHEKLLRWLPLGAIGWAVLGTVALLLPAFVAHPWFDGRWTNWIGLVTRLPVTQDYVPLLPWLGVAAWGHAIGLGVLARWPALLQGPLPAGLPADALVWMGRHALSWYMLHQPVMIGAITAAGWLLR